MNAVTPRAGAYVDHKIAWPFGAAVSLILMLTVLAITAAVSRKAQDLI